MSVMGRLPISLIKSDFNYLFCHFLFTNHGILLQGDKTGSLNVPPPQYDRAIIFSSQSHMELFLMSTTMQPKQLSQILHPYKCITYYYTLFEIQRKPVRLFSFSSFFSLHCSILFHGFERWERIQTSVL